MFKELTKVSLETTFTYKFRRIMKTKGIEAKNNIFIPFTLYIRLTITNVIMNERYSKLNLIYMLKRIKSPNKNKLLGKIRIDKKLYKITKK
jgi:hypothetical protein